MDADERLTALKRAYADMILNTAKEAAARIMLSEQKALRFEYELNNVKQDSVQMLLRVKLMMDSKVNEAQLASRAQQMKIEELEAQLQEAEDIVNDLRQELSFVQAELDRFPPRKQVKHTVQVNEASQENILDNNDKTFYNSLLPLKKYYIHSTDLPSIISRSKETELYRNGCTQRVRACEKLRKTPSLAADIACDVEGKDVIHDDRRVSSCSTSTSSVKHVNDKKSDEDTNTQSTIKEEPVSFMHEHVDFQQKSKGLVDFSLGNSESKACEAIGGPMKDRVIKFTFQRKRKRGMLSTEENQNGGLESETANLLEESTQACVFV